MDRIPHRYHLTAGMYGYIPNEIRPHTSRAVAREAARDEAEGYRESGFRVRGSMRNGYEYGHLEPSPSGYFGYIQVEDCTWGADCAVGMDDW